MARLRIVQFDIGTLIPRCLRRYPESYGASLEAVTLAEALDSPDPAVFFLNGQQPAQVAGRLALLAQRPRIRAGLKDRFALAIDASGEGYPITPSLMAEWHAVLDAAGIPAGRIAYLTHNDRAPADYRAFLRDTARAEGMRVLLHHPFLHMQALWVKDNRPFTGDSPEAAPPWRMLCLNNKPHAHRMVVTGRILGGAMAERTLLSFGGATKGVARMEMAPFLLDARRLLPRFAKDLDVLEQRLGDLPLTIEGDSQDDVVVAMPPALYGRAAMSLVTETNFVQPRVRRFTEKSVKAFAAGHPTLLAAAPGTLRLLRGIGFASFDPYIDEAYDDLSDPEERMQAVLAEAERICLLPERDFAFLMQRCRPAAEHNMRYAAGGLAEWAERSLGELARALAWMARPGPG